MSQSFFPGELGIRALVDGAIVHYAVPKERLQDLDIAAKVPLRVPDRISTYFWVEIMDITHDELGDVFHFRPVAQK